MNRTSSLGLLHCHCFLYAYPRLWCSLPHTDMSNFHPHEGILYVRIQHLVSKKWASSSDISKALTRLGALSKSSAAIGLAGNAQDGKWVPAQFAPQCVRCAHKNAYVRAMATAAAALQLQWDQRSDASIPNDRASLPPAEATNASQPSNSDTSPSQTSTTTSSQATTTPTATCRVYLFHIPKASPTHSSSSNDRLLQHCRGWKRLWVAFWGGLCFRPWTRSGGSKFFWPQAYFFQPPRPYTYEDCSTPPQPKAPFCPLPPFSPVFPPVSPPFPPRFSPFPPVFPRSPPVVPRFPPIFPATGNQTLIGYGNLGPLQGFVGMHSRFETNWLIQTTSMYLEIGVASNTYPRCRIQDGIRAEG